MSEQRSISVPFMDLGRDHAPLADHLRREFDRVLASSGFILGAEVERFEAEWAAYCGTSHCVGVSSGTAALSIMLEAAGVQPGDEVIVPAHTFVATALAVLRVGAIPVCVDVQPESGLLDPAAVAAAVGPATSAILPVHLYGQVCRMDPLRALAERHGLLLLEDAAQAQGATYQGRRSGGLAEAAAFSFYPSKNLGALGDAGAICTNNASLADAARRLRDLGRDPSGEHAAVAGNDRLDGLQAAFLRVKIPYLDGWNAARRDAAHSYRELLRGAAELLGEHSDSPCIYHLFPVRVDDRDSVAAALAQAGIATGVHYPRAVPDQPALAPLLQSGAVKASTTPAARAWAARELSLPMFPGLRQDEMETVANALKRVLSDYTAATSGNHGGSGKGTDAGALPRDLPGGQPSSAPPAARHLSTVAGRGERE